MATGLPVARVGGPEDGGHAAARHQFFDPVLIELFAAMECQHGPLQYILTRPRFESPCERGSCYSGPVNVGITCYPTYGGSGIVATELGMELAARGHEVHFITYANPIRLDPDTPRIHYHEVEVSNYPLFQYPPYSLALASRMSEVAESYDLDLLHVHYAIPHSISALLAKQILVRRAGCRSSPRCTEPISRWWAPTARIIPSRAFRSSNRMASPR